MIIGIVILVFFIRLYFLKISIKNEQRILAEGGTEYGKENSKRITILHILFYLGCSVEAFIHKTQFDNTISIVGLILVVFSMFMLYVVTQLLKDIWTVKLMLVKNHKYNDHWLFRVVKHPNYFLNIVPELVGLALFCHAKYTAMILLPLYAIVLYIRIKEEENILKNIIIPNGTM